MEVHVMVFEHRHGCDITAYANDALAVAEGARRARRWWSEARQRDRSLPAEPPESDVEAFELYFAAQESHESCVIAGCEVEGLESNEPGTAAGTGDPYELRCAVERVVGEDRVPADVLERLVAEFGDRAPGTEAEIPVELRVNGAEAIQALFSEAADSESETLEELVEQAELGWKCRAQMEGLPCNHMNVGTWRCGACGAADRRKEHRDG